MNRWNVIALYAGIICLISMGCVIFHVVSLSQSVLKLTLPWYLETSISGTNFYFQDNQAYTNYRCPSYRTDKPCLLTGKSDAEIAVMLEHDAAEYHAKEVKRIQELSLKSVVDDTIATIISLLFFFIHWRILRRSLTTPLH